MSKVRERVERARARIDSPRAHVTHLQHRLAVGSFSPQGVGEIVPHVNSFGDLRIEVYPIRFWLCARVEASYRGRDDVSLCLRILDRVKRDHGRFVGKPQYHAEDALQFGLQDGKVPEGNANPTGAFPELIVG